MNMAKTSKYNYFESLTIVLMKHFFCVRRVLYEATT